MKKKIALILCVVMALTMLCGCDEKVSLKKYEQMFADIGIMCMNEVSPEITQCKNHYKDEVYHDEYDPAYLADKEYIYSGFYVIDTNVEETIQIAKKYETYLIEEGFERVNGREDVEDYWVVLEREEYVIDINTCGMVQWEGYEDQYGMFVRIYK